MKRIILTSLIFLYGTGLYAYSVSGRVLDVRTGDTLSNVSVAIEELQIVKVTSADGAFNFRGIHPGFYTVHIAHPFYGNKIITIRVKRNFTIDIELTEKVYGFSPIINSYGENEIRAGKQSISSDDIRYMPMSGAGDSLHLLQSLPGVGNSFSLASVPVIRGLNPIYDKTYIDDIPVDYPYHYIPPIIPLLSSINETIIDNATLYKGPYPMIYDDSIGSIIQVKTKEVENPGVHGKIILNPILPLFPTIYCEAAPTADFSILFAGRRTYIDTALEAVQIDTSNTFYLQDYYLKLKYNYLSRHRFYFTAMGSDDYVAIKKYDARTQYHAESFKWQYLINKMFFVETSFLRNMTNQYYTDKNVKAGEIPINLTYSPLMYRFTQTLTSSISIFDIKTGYEFILHKDGVSGNIDLSNLVDFDISKLSGYNSSISFPIAGKTISIFNETGIDLHPVHLNFGARYKHYGPLSTDSFSYRGMASYIFKNQNLKIYGGGGSYHAQPDMYYYLGNFRSSMKESRSYNGVLGVEKKLSEKITGQIETYYSKYQDLFSLNSGNNAGTMLQRLSQINPYSKDASGSTFGSECFIKGNIGPIYGWTSYTLSKTRMSDGVNEYYSDYDQTHIFKIALLSHMGKWTPSAIWHYSTSMPYTPITGSASDGSGGYNPRYGSYNSKRYGPQHKLDLKLSYTVDNTRLYAEIWNVYYIKGYDPDDGDIKTNRSYLFPVFDRSKPYSSSNPENQADVPGAFFWMGVEICF